MINSLKRGRSNRLSKPGGGSSGSSGGTLIRLGTVEMLQHTAPAAEPPANGPPGYAVSGTATETPELPVRASWIGASWIGACVEPPSRFIVDGEVGDDDASRLGGLSSRVGDAAERRSAVRGVGAGSESDRRRRVPLGHLPERLHQQRFDRRVRFRLG